MSLNMSRTFRIARRLSISLFGLLRLGQFLSQSRSSVTMTVLNTPATQLCIQILPVWICLTLPMFRAKLIVLRTSQEWEGVRPLVASSQVTHTLHLAHCWLFHFGFLFLFLFWLRWHLWGFWTVMLLLSSMCNLEALAEEVEVTDTHSSRSWRLTIYRCRLEVHILSHSGGVSPPLPLCVRVSDWPSCDQLEALVLAPAYLCHVPFTLWVLPVSWHNETVQLHLTIFLRQPSMKRPGW